MICISIPNMKADKCIELIKEKRMAEIRLDLNDYSTDEIKCIFSVNNRLIATCRRGRYSDEERTYILIQAIESGVAFVDIEYESSRSFKKELLSCAREHYCRIIISYHNYQYTPSKQVLQNIIDECLCMGADIVKIACKVDSIDESARILSLYEENKHLVAIGMGKKGKITRLAAPFLGAPFTFVSSGEDKETAEGQIDIESFSEVMKILNG